MERYTKRLDDGQAVMDCQNCPVSWVNEPNSDCTALYCRNRLKDRVAAYEDILGDDYDLDRLRELVEADRKGRCVVLPCKLHDKVFFIENGCVKETEVYAFHNWTSGRWKISTRTNRMFDYWKGYEIDFSGIGKTVFLTREAAEAALKRLTD